MGPFVHIVFLIQFVPKLSQPFFLPIGCLPSLSFGLFPNAELIYLRKMIRY